MHRPIYNAHMFTQFWEKCNITLFKELGREYDLPSLKDFFRTKVMLLDTRWYFTYVNSIAELLVTCKLHIIWYFLVYFDRLNVIYDS